MNYVLLIINIFMLVCGQVLWKIGMNKLQLQVSIKNIINILLNPYIFSGGIMYVFATFIWLNLLSKEQLSRIYPLQSLCYIVGAIVGIIVFRENLSVFKILGALLIFSGAILIGVK